MQHRYSQHLLVKKALRLVWLIVTLFGEVWVFTWTLFDCNWPSVRISRADDGQVPSTRVLLVADTQIQHHALLTKQSWWFHPLRRIVFELNLRKSWHLTSYLRPDVVVFLGDMLSNGKAAKVHQEYKAAAGKFKSIFHTNSRTQVHYIPGNNDVGLGLDRSTSRLLRSFYEEFFGDPNRKFVLQNHTFIGINSAGLAEEDYLRNGEHVPFQDWTPLRNGTVSFVKRVAQHKRDPVILLSHIPLARPESAQCGPLREQGTIRRGAGPGWQSMLSKQSTDFLLSVLRPSIIFSADNRDYCDHTHTILPQPRDPSAQGYHIREITLKSFSLSVHIRRPGFQLLTLVDPAYLSPQTHLGPKSHGPPSLAEQACFLPDQFRIYNYLYAPLFVLSLLILARFHFFKLKKWQFKTKPPLLAVETGLAGKISEDRSLLCESPSSPNSPGAEPMWSPFVPFTPVRPPCRTLSSTMRQSSTTSVASVDSFFPHSGRCSSTTTLLGGETGNEGEYHFDIKHEQDLQLVYDSLPEYTMSKPEKLPFSFTSMSAWDDQHGNFTTPRYPYTRKSSITDLESFQDEVVEEEAPSLRDRVSEKLNDNLISSSGRIRFLLRWYTSSSFIFRRRRIRLGFLPSRRGVWNLMEFLGVVDEKPSLSSSSSSLLDTRRSRRGARFFSLQRSGLQDDGYLVDLVVVFWPAMLLWLVVNGMSMVV